MNVYEIVLDFAREERGVIRVVIEICPDIF